MKTKKIVKSSLFPANKEEIFLKLQKIETLQYIAKPFARFIPLDDNQSIKWKEGAKLSFRLYIFGFIPFGTHKIDVISFDKDSGISTLENNKHIPIWNHQIYLEPVDEGTTRYSDEVEIGASWKTPFVALWAKAFYTHRQRKWKRLLRN
jgi:hypothetical protein